MWTVVRCIHEIVELDDCLFVEFSPRHPSCGGVHAFGCGLVSFITFLNVGAKNACLVSGSVACLIIEVRDMVGNFYYR